MAHRVNDHKTRLPVAQATVLALPPPGQAKVSAFTTHLHGVLECTGANLSLVVAH